VKNYLLTTIICFLFTFNCFTQETGEDKLGAWYMYSGTHKISEKLNLKSMIQVRTYETVSDFNIFFALAGGSYHVNNNLSANLNYGFLRWDRSFEDTDNPDTIEHRINESLSLSNKSGKFSFVNRLGLDHRFIDNKSSYETQHRVRYKFNLKHPISNGLYVSVFDEIFYNLERFKFQQNRLYGALGINLTNTCKFELGYMKWSFKSISFDRLQLGLSIKTDWRKKDSKS